MSYYPDLYATLVSAAMLTLFELIYFKYGIFSQVKGGFDAVFSYLGMSVPEIYDLALFRVVKKKADNEGDFLDEVNFSVTLDGGYIIVALLLGIVFVVTKEPGVVKSFTSNFFILLSFSLFVLFQLNFISLATNYNYASTEEIALKVKDLLP